MLGHGGQLRHLELALDLRQVAEVAQPEGDEELARGLEEVRPPRGVLAARRSEEHTSELQSHSDLVCRLLLEKKKEPLLTRTARSKSRPIACDSSRSKREDRQATCRAF